MAENAPAPTTHPVFQDVRFVTSDGLKLAARDYGDRNSPWLPVVCLPGLTRNVRDFDALATYLAGHAERPRRVVSFDSRGRGRSDWDPDATHYNVGVEMMDVLAGMAALGVPRAAVVGTSRGGIIGMLMAFTRPQTIAALVLNDIGPFVEPRGLLRLKTYVGRTPKADDWADAARIQRRVHGSQFTAFDDADWDAFARMTYRDEDGLPEGDYDPRLADTLAGVDLEKPGPGLWDEFRSLRPIPILAIRGANSDLLSAASLERMVADHGRLEAVTVADEGHPPMLRGALLPRIAAFLAKAEDTPAQAAPAALSEIPDG